MWPFNVRLSIALAMVLIGGFVCTAQLYRTDTARFATSIQGSTSLTLGNVERILLFGSADVQYVADVVGIKSRTTSQYGFFGERTTDSETNSRTVVYLFPRDTNYLFATYWYTTSLQRKIDDRSLVSAGYTRLLQHDSVTLVKLSASLAYEHTAFSSNAFAGRGVRASRVIITPRIVLWLYGAHDLGTQPIQLEYEGWLAPSLSDFANLRFYGNGALRWPLAAHLSLSLSVVATAESVVVAGRRPYDVLFLAGCAMRW